MWVDTGSWVLDIKKATSFIIFESERQIRIYWTGEGDPDLLDFNTENGARLAYSKIVAGLKKSETYIKLDLEF